MNRQNPFVAMTAALVLLIVSEACGENAIQQIFRPRHDVRADENVRPTQSIDAAAWI